MSTPTVNRQPQGIPVGGQFAATTHAEPSGVHLDEPLGTQKQAHADLLSDRLSPAEDAAAARDAVVDTMISGDFGADSLRVAEYVQDDRLVRLAVDRYVVNESVEPGKHDPEKTGENIGRYLVELRDEDLEDAEAGLEYAE